MRRLLETVAACRNVELTRASALVGPRRAVYATDGSLPGELASAAFAVAAKDERLIIGLELVLSTDPAPSI